MKVSFNLIVASLIAWAIGSFAAPVSSNTFAYPYGDSDVAVVNTSHQETFIYGTHGFYLYSYNVTVQLAVKNKAFNKVVGIRYTNSSWSDYYEAFATYTSKIDANYELWTLTIDRGNHYTSEPRPEYIVAGFASYNQGARVWDPRNDYYIYDRATQQQPLLLLNGVDGTTVSYNTDSKKVELSGAVRTYTPNRAAFSKPNSVLVRWSIDNWKTFQDTPALPSRFDLWSFTIPLTTPDLNLASNVQFAIQFKNSASSSYWLNNDNKNFAKTLKPTVSYTNLDKTPTLSGINYLSYSVFSDLYLGTYKARIDGGEWKQFNSPENPSFYIESQLLPNGKHTVDILVSLYNGPDVLSSSYTFLVDNHITFKGQWVPKSPALPAEALSSWSASAYNGKIYFGFGSGTAARYSSFGTTDAPDVIYSTNASVYSSVDKIAVDATNVYTLAGYKVAKFDEKTGNRDLNFGVDGAIDVSYTANYNNKNVCYPSGLVVIGENLIVSDSCNFRLLKFTTAGAFVSSFDYGNLEYVYAISATGKTLITSIYNYPSTTLYEVNPTDFSVISTTKYENFGSIESVLKLSDKSFVVNQGGSLLNYLNDGKSVGTFNGYGPKLMPGSFSIGKTLTDLGDGTFFLVSVEGSALERFDAKLA
ncbi:hypothetical protein HDU97_009281 [Phlyctochytrium planicorne]|nr:hypothetical protein HDU97_009281 [Phlyctochytrium planicorne]